MATISFHISSKSINDSAELSVRLCGSRRVVQRTRTRVYVPIKLWSEEKQRLMLPRFVTPEVRAAQELQKTLEDMRLYIFDRYIEDFDIISKGWLKRVIVDFWHRGAPMESLKDVILQYIEAQDLQTRTADHYRVLYRLVEKYEEKRDPLYMKYLATHDIEGFARFLRMGGTTPTSGSSRTPVRGQNTVNSKLRHLRAVCTWWCKGGDGRQNPFDNYSIPTDVYGTPIWLTNEERERIYRAPMPSEAMAVQRDIFVFQCLVGCRVSDLMSLTPKNVTEDGFLQYIQQKLSRKVPITMRIPLSDTALEIIKRYEGTKKGKRLLPFISDVKYNVVIKKILQAAGIDRMVMVQNNRTYKGELHPIYEVAASHLARRTFAANLYKKTRDARLVSSLTGHADGSAAFKRYTEVDDDMKRDVIRSLEVEKEE